MTGFLSYDPLNHGFFKRLNRVYKAGLLTRATFGQPKQTRSSRAAPEPRFGEPRDTQLDSR
jgi:hypothetical protein